ncbi:uncharacterized protein si:dkey-250k15.4 [Betta splendens]|uniref:Uncharacterized protein si:dkey-250k15.4 n=1 Tax=Betta splendens TaxID=158456 RepID=A0A6P7KQ21_BETSP|nr:uncharacterized protein si:dkey-250k15.4 [Betta splendens]XP_055359103.1 uncharacterized protein si:dkey-250k15.4 [Betta splendens]
MSQMKNKILNVLNKHSKETLNSCSSVNSLAADCKCCKHHNNTHKPHKMKRWRSRKERTQMRAGGREAPKAKSHHHHQNIKNFSHFHNCCHSSCYCTPRKGEPYPNRIPAPQEPSIITDNRLIGHHGLFNHEVKSVDIERLLSEQKKREKSKQQVPEKSCILSRQSSASHNLSPFSSRDWSGRDTNEAVQCARMADPAANAPECREKEKTLSQESDITPGQRLQKPDPSSGSYKSILSSNHSSLDVVAFKNKKYNSVMSDRCTESPLSPTGDRDHVKKLKKKLKTHLISTPDHTPKEEKPPVLPTQAPGLRPSPLQCSSSPTTQSFNITHISQDFRCVSKSVSEVAARLCDFLHFPVLRKGNLVAESREEVLRALREKHGAHLRENLLKVKRSLGGGADLTRAMADEDALFPSDAPEHQSDNAVQFCFDIQRTHRKTPEWLTEPMDTSTSLLDGVLRPSFSPTLYMNCEPPEVSANNHSFSNSADSCWAEFSSSQHWGESFSRSTSKESFLCDSFENSYLNHSSASTGSFRPQYGGNNIQPFFTHTAQLTDRRAAEPGPFLTDRYSNYQSFCAQNRHPTQSNNFHTFSQFTQPSSCPSLRPHYTDMIHYPPSHMLEIEAAPPLSSLPSPEPWSFPPMRLY